MWGPGGHFSIAINPALSDGIYTAIAVQGATGGTGFSAPRTFRIKVHGPALTLAVPSAGGAVVQADEVFAGQAGVVPGDYAQVSLWLYRGTRARGRPLGVIHAAANGAGWSVRWPHKLKLGLYTAKAVQGDDAGHTTTTRSAYVPRRARADCDRPRRHARPDRCHFGEHHVSRTGCSDVHRNGAGADGVKAAAVAVLRRPASCASCSATSRSQGVRPRSSATRSAPALPARFVAPTPRSRSPRS